MAPEGNSSLAAKQEEGSIKVVRARVWRACEVCRRRKIKCDGQEPCAYCLSSGKTCSFKEINDNAAGARQYAITVDNRLARVEEDVQKLIPMAKAFETWLRTHDNSLPFRKTPEADNTPISTIPSSSHHPSSSTIPIGEKPYKPSRTIQHLAQYPNPDKLSSPPGLLGPTPHSDTIVDEEMGDSAGQRWSDRFSFVAKDSYGNLRYIGGASSLMLVEALNSLSESGQADESPVSASSDKMRKATVDAELPFFKRNKQFRPVEALPLPESLVFPSPHVADELVTSYFTHIHHTFPILHQQTFINRYIRVMEARQVDGKVDDHAFLSCVFAVFACALTVVRKSPPSSVGQGSDPHSDFAGIDMYERAQLMFWLSSGTNQIELIQSLALQAICNASWNTLATSWINAGQALRRAQDLGLHRSPRRLPLNPLEKEIRRRVWWCVYGLDRVLSMALGRPSGASDEDCDVELPAEIDDGQLQSSNEGNIISTGETFMTGYTCLLQIYIIAGKIVRQVQSSRIEDPTKDDRMTRTVRALDQELSHWVENLPNNVRYAVSDRKNPKMLALCLIAFFVYYSAIINLYRPFIPDSFTSSNDLTSLAQCVNAAKSCIRIGDMVKEMLPTSHHLAFAVQYITLSGVLLLRCVAYVKQPNLVSAVIVDAEKCVELLEGMEEIWPGAKRCREIVSDLLVVVKAKHFGGPSALEIIHTSQDQGLVDHVPPEVPQGKRKMPSDFDIHGTRANDTRSRQRVEDHSNPWSHHPSQIHSDRSLEGEFSGSSSRVSDSSHPMARLSDVRTPVDHSDLSPNVQRHSSHHPQFLAHTSSVPLKQMYHPRDSTPLLEPPKLSLDLNALSAGREIDGLPFSGYDFLGGDLYALIGSVFRPQPDQPPEQCEEHGQLLWRAYGQMGEHLGQEQHFPTPYEGQLRPCEQS